MKQGTVILETPHRTVRIPVTACVVVGRAIDCDVYLEDDAASRHHAEIRTEAGKYYWRDLGSTNGTLVNGKKLPEGELHDGDRLQVGETVLSFVLEDRPEGKAGTDTAQVTSSIANWDAGVTAAPVDAGPEALLRAVYAVINEISSNYEPCTLIDRVLETTVQAINAQRGALFFAEDPEDGPQPCPVCGKYHLIDADGLRRVEREEIRVSSTVAHRVLTVGESLLYKDSAGDSELNLAESVVSLDLRSIICVPVRGKSGILGALYLDTNRPGHQYTHEHMLLSTAVGNSAGLAFENATMHLEILEKQRIEQEIQHAWIIQQGFLTKEWPQAPSFDVFGQTHPAKTVGGDFYDFTRPAENRAGILIGDVSGKGVPAALTMAQLLADFRLLTRDADSPARVFTFLNDDLFVRSQRGTFCTACYLDIDLDSGDTLCVNAGHHPPLLLRGETIEAFAEPSGPPIGVTESGAWADTGVRLEPGDTVLLYTDGIVEARDGKRPRERGDMHEFGLDQLMAAAARFGGDGPGLLVKAVHDEVVAYCEPGVPHDDCTMIAFRYVAPNGGE